MSNTSTPNPSIYTISTDYPPTSSFNEDGNPISSFGSIHTPPFLREMVEDVFGGSLNVINFLSSGSNYCILISGEQLAPRVLCKSHWTDHYQFLMLINWTTIRLLPTQDLSSFPTPPPPYTTGYNLAANLTGFAQSSNDDNVYWLDPFLDPNNTPETPKRRSELNRQARLRNVRQDSKNELVSCFHNDD
ncbi:hypothetical protein Pst134EA_029069 [Puccinia striiformis f. sp. tritici]|uniref:hypothetical protein n=1 Tax=Puccinia striiformis f. sp. tritici TaxID=168172 RepID=UPI002008BD96|nr:hypothetical protein Pst134EA_029069 [Puccinia striiformis f. sp. tritici]KAH9447082.1 hypothetical protein Pst134EA_029069 [Puccinia striiformis f. sp. tritici]